MLTFDYRFTVIAKIFNVSWSYLKSRLKCFNDAIDRKSRPRLQLQRLRKAWKLAVGSRFSPEDLLAFVGEALVEDILHSIAFFELGSLCGFDDAIF